METLFDKRFRDFYPTLLSMAAQFARKTPIPVEEFESRFSEVFFTQYKVYDAERANGNFNAFMRVSLQQEGVRISSRKERRYYDSVQYIDSIDQDDDGADYSLELTSDVDVEEQVFDAMFVEEQLAKADETTRKILTEFFVDPYVSFREIARRLDLNDKLVKRRLESVAEAIR